MLALVVNRTKAFYERVYKPFGLATDTQLKRLETQIKKTFASARSPSRLAFAFLSNFEQVETNIVQHRKIPDKIKYEIEALLSSWITDKDLEEAKAFLNAWDQSPKGQ